MPHVRLPDPNDLEATKLDLRLPVEPELPPPSETRGASPRDRRAVDESVRVTQSSCHRVRGLLGRRPVPPRPPAFDAPKSEASAAKPPPLPGRLLTPESRAPVPPVPDAPISRVRSAAARNAGVLPRLPTGASLRGRSAILLLLTVAFLAWGLARAALRSTLRAAAPLVLRARDRLKVEWTHASERARARSSEQR